MTRRRRRGSPPAPSPPHEDDDLLREILLRLPPQPSSLPRASAVCKRWRCVAVDPKFIARFRAHHGKPPLLGVFQRRDDGIVFAPVLAPLDRVPPQRFDLRIRGVDNHPYLGPQLLGCRHGRVLVFDRVRGEVLVCDTITGEERRVAVPSEFKMGYDKDHVHGGCNSSPFKVVLVFMRIHDFQTLARAYSSETNTWGHPIPSQQRLHIQVMRKTAYFSLIWIDGILQFEAPPGMNVPRSCQIVQAQDGTLGLAILSHHYHNIEMWQRNVNCHGVATWVLRKTTEMHDILGLPPHIEVARRGWN